MGIFENKRQQAASARVQGRDGDGNNESTLGSKPAAMGTDEPVIHLRHRMTESRTSHRDEARWIQQAQGGDKGAFDSLIQQHFARVYSLLFRMIGNHEDAEDLAQECFIKAQGALMHFRKESRFSTWVFRIAVHLSRDHFRRRSRRPQVLELSEELPPASPQAGPAAESSGREFQAALRRALDQLTHKRRVALVLRTQEGMEYPEIAQVLECNQQTARVHVMKARKQLRDWLGAWNNEGGPR